MLLTDPAVQYWSCVVAILVTAAVLMLWNKVHGPRVVTGVSRFGLLLGGYAATAVAVLVSVNIAYGGLIVSVSDLFANVNPPMGQFVNHGGCGHGHEIQAGATSATSASAHEPAGRAYADAGAPPPGVDPAVDGGDGGRLNPPCRSAASAAAPDASSAPAAAAATPAEARALK
jgi:hypothetical protein